MVYICNSNLSTTHCAHHLTVPSDIKLEHSFVSCSLQEEEFFISLAQQQREVRSVSRSRQQTLTPLAWPDCAPLYSCTQFWFSLSGLV